MTYRSFGHRLPGRLAAPLFGDRERHGLITDTTDPDWAEWQRTCVEFYHATQRRSAGNLVNEAGYRVMTGLDIADRQVLEIGPGEIRHLRHWRGRPEVFTIMDIRPEMLDHSSMLLERAGVPWRSVLIEKGKATLPFPDESFDLVLSFYSLEHIYPIEPYLAEIMRVLRPGGLLAGAIPCEGGGAWGLGRYLTSRRWLKRHSNIDPDKIICWEHPNFADAILNRLDTQLDHRSKRFWPLLFPSIDLNLVVSFVYEKR